MPAFQGGVNRHAPLVVEVVVRQGATVIDVATLAGRRGAYRIGEGPRAQATVAVAGAGADGCWTLIALGDEGPRLALPTGAGGELRTAAAEAARPLAAGDAVVLADGTCAIVHVGPLTFALRAAPAEPAIRFEPAIEWPLWLAQAASLALFVSLALIVRVYGPSAGPPRWDDPEVQERLVRYVAGLPPTLESAPRSPSERAGTISPAPVARPLRPTSVPRAHEPVAATAPAPRAAREVDPEDMSRRAGFLGLAEFDRILRDYTGSLERSIHHYMPSAADDSAWAAAAKAVPRAIAGLGLADTVRGGGGEAGGVVDLDLGQLLASIQARRARGLPGQGRKEAAFTGGPAHEVREAPRQSIEWTASVGQDLIRGVVRRHTPEVRRCFREGPATGKIEVAFTIAAGGKVRAASIAATTVGDPAVQACVTEAVKSWTFPTIVAATGEVAVRYPFSVG